MSKKGYWKMKKEWAHLRNESTDLKKKSGKQLRLFRVVQRQNCSFLDFFQELLYVIFIVVVVVFDIWNMILACSNGRRRWNAHCQQSFLGLNLCFAHSLSSRVTVSRWMPSLPDSPHARSNLQIVNPLVVSLKISIWWHKSSLGTLI